MSIASTDLIFYACADLPISDTATAGGAIDTTARPALTQLTAPAKVALVSDGADTRSVQIIGRLASGSLGNESRSLNGTTEVVSTNTYERVLSITVTSASSSRTITCKQGSGGTAIATITPNELARYVAFQNAASGASIQTRYDKQFAKNTNGTLSLLGAQVTLTSDPSATIMIGLAPSVNDTATITNRVTSPGLGLGAFVDDNVAVTVPGTDLAAGTAVGVWIQQTLAANAAAAKSTFTLQLAGSTT